MRNEELEISNDGGDASNIKASQNFKYKKTLHYELCSAPSLLICH